MTATGFPVSKGGEQPIIPFGLCSAGTDGPIDLTIHRRTETPHGRTLMLLGHAAEYLTHSRSFATGDIQGDRDAIHMLLRLSREVFEDYATSVEKRRRIGDWMMDWMTRICD